MADWDDEDFEVGEPKAPGPRTDKWDGEDSDDSIKDAWDAESEEEGENKEDKPKTEGVKPIQKKKKKKLADIIAEKEEAKLKDLEARKRAEEEAILLRTPEAILAEKLRLQKMLEDQDLELAKDMAGVTESNSAGINFNPNSKEDYDELRDTLLEKFRDIDRSSELYQDFACSLITQMSMDLTVATLKKIKTDIEGFISAKLKEERAAKAKKGKPANKATIKMDTDRAMFARGIDDYNDMDDFM
jgi:translation initiation factor 3 subunit J